MSEDKMFDVMAAFVGYCVEVKGATVENAREIAEQFAKNFDQLQAAYDLGMAEQKAKG